MIAPRRITLVGAGLVGSLLSIFLAKRGFTVEIFERRGDMRKEPVAAGRSVNLAVSTRGLYALKELGLEDQVLAQGIPMKGRMIHPLKGELGFQRYGKDDSESIHSISRGVLNELLLNEAEKTGRVKIHFHSRVLGYDPGNETLKVQNDLSQDIQNFQTDLVIGTDGSASALRATLEQLPGFQCSAENLDYGYKELTIPALKESDSTHRWQRSEAFAMEKHALHIWPRGNFMLIALPNLDGSYTCTLFLPFEGTQSFANLKSSQEIKTFFEAYFPDAVPLMPALDKTFVENPTGHMVTVRGMPWNFAGKLLLLGDASHAIVPFFGQGMNCGFEDCTVLNQMMDQERDWEKLFTRFSNERKPDADAIATMALENFVEMRDKVGDPKFLVEKEVEKILMKEFPGEYVSRYGLVTFSRIPYRIALKAGKIHDQILSKLCSGLARADQVDVKRASELIRSSELSQLSRA